MWPRLSSRLRRTKNSSNCHGIWSYSLNSAVSVCFTHISRAIQKITAFMHDKPSCFSLLCLRIHKHRAELRCNDIEILNSWFVKRVPSFGKGIVCNQGPWVALSNPMRYLMCWCLLCSISKLFELFVILRLASQQAGCIRESHLAKIGGWSNWWRKVTH